MVTAQQTDDVPVTTGGTASSSIEPAVLAAFAHAVARPGLGAMMLGPNNRLRGWHLVSNAISSGGAFAVQVADHVLAIDGDDVSESQLAKLLADLESAGLLPVVIASGQPGRVHVFARAWDSRVRNSIRGRAKTLGFDDRSAARIRPPLSPHRLGLERSLLVPDDPLEALRRLIDVSPAPEELSARMAELLRCGDSRKKYDSRSEVVQAIAQAAVNAGWDEKRLFNELVATANIAGERVREEAHSGGFKAAESYVRRSFRVALLKTAEEPPAGPRARRTIEQLRDGVQRELWAGIAGASRRAVYEGLLHVAEVAQNLAFSASVRQVALEAGLGRGATNRALTRLVNEGRLKIIELGVGRRATSWELLVPAQDEDTKLTPPVDTEVSGTPTQYPHDAFRWGALGKTAARLWNSLPPEGGLRVPQLANILLVHESTARRNLLRLESVGMARQVADGGWIRLDRDLDAVASELGTKGASERQRDQDDADRLGYRARRESRWKPLMINGRVLDGGTGEILSSAPNVGAMSDAK